MGNEEEEERGYKKAGVIWCGKLMSHLSVQSL